MKILFCSGNVKDELKSTNVMIEANGDVYSGLDRIAYQGTNGRYMITSTGGTDHPELMELTYDCIRIVA